MGDPGNPTDGGTPPEPDPEQPGWASPNPPPPGSAPPPPPAPEPTVPATPPAAPPPGAVPPPPPPGPPTSPATPAWGSPPPVAPGPPAGAPAWSDPAAGPPKKRRLTWLWFLIPLMLVLIASTVVVVVFGVKIFTGPVDATNDYYADLKAGRYEEAYASLCAPARRAFSERAFVNSQVQAERANGRITDYNFDNVELGDDSDFKSSEVDATVKGTIERGGRTLKVAVGLQHDNGDWHVCATAGR